MGTQAKIQVGTQIYLGKLYLAPNTGRRLLDRDDTEEQLQTSLPQR
jgi:hypothetical protein